MLTVLRLRRERADMRVVVSIALTLLWEMPAHADWQYTKWGMTPEQVIEASGGTVSKIPAGQQPGKSRPGFVALLSGVYSTGDFNFKVDFQFAKDKLEMVGMNLVEHDRCKRLQSALLSRYGPPWENRSNNSGPHLIWHDRESGNTVQFSDAPSIYVCHVLYERLEVTGAKGL
jgi:hypothetical protein